MSFSLKAGQVLGLIGENGSGKSTTMNIVGGVLRADIGSMTIDGKNYAPSTPLEAANAGVAFIHQELNLFENLSVAENLAIKKFPKVKSWLPVIAKKNVMDRAIALLRDVDLTLDPKLLVSRLAQGERQLVEIAGVLAGDAKIIIFDEPTTSLTAREAVRLFSLINRLKKSGIGIIYISHILEDVQRLCDQVITLRDGVLVDSFPASEAPIDRMASGMLGRSMTDFYPPPSASRKSVHTALEVRGLTQPGIIHDISFSIAKGEVVGISGLMGSGRSETARIIFGLDPAKTGEVLINRTLLRHRSPRSCMAMGMAFLTEDRRNEGIMMALGVTANIELARLADLPLAKFFGLSKGFLKKNIAELAASLSIKAKDLTRLPVRYLSGGNQQKVVLGKWLLRKPSILILDEPTRGIDIGAKAEIYQLIQKLAGQGTAVLVISSQLEELTAICDRILTMAHGEIVKQFTGPNYDREAIYQASMQTQTEELQA
jgi:ribose transport system ATP-binding protein